MRRFAIVVLFLLSGPALIAGNGPFEIDELLDGMWLFRVPADSAEYTNSLVIERDRGLLVVESQPSPAAARRLLEAIGEVSDKPVRFLVFSHPHVESTGGASAFPESTLVIAGETTYDALKDETTSLGADIPLRAADPDSWVAPPRVLPDIVIVGRLSLTDGPHRVELLTLPRGHYPGSTIVHLPEHEIYYVGAQVTADRNPYADPEYTDPEGWSAWINSLLFSRPDKVVPIRGKTLDTDAVREFRDLLAWLLGRVNHALIERIPEEDIVEFTIESEGFDKHFDVDAKPFFGRGMVQRTLDERLGKKR
jgi:glyoxylase-like metal-dependent hydrolase (beta-lactamase superfamily II)